ncbi:MAG TPA: hypothetical protein VNO32_15525, partial [Candidatus Acidoferrum sp.]|nr:hypothetical protein [Candidatus Acidoferrum sp.]
KGEAVKLGEITEQHFDAAFGLNARGTLFTVQKALPLFNDGGSIIMTGTVASVKGAHFMQKSSLQRHLPLNALGNPDALEFKSCKPRFFQEAVCCAIGCTSRRRPVSAS